MKKTMFTALVSFLLLSSNVLQAQVPEPPPDFLPHEPGYENAADAYGQNVLTRADRMIQSKDQNGALFLLTENFDRFTRLRAAFFSKMLSTYLVQDNIKEARQFYLQYVRHDPELARAGIDQIHSYYVQKKDNSAITEWTAQLMELPLPDDLMPQVFAWQLKSVCSSGITDETRALVKTSIGKFNAETCRSIFSPTITSLVESGKYEEAGRFLNIIDREDKGARDLRSMVMAARTRILFLQKQWKTGEKLFMKNAADLRNDDLAGLVSFTASKARKSEELDAADRMCMFVINSQKGNNNAKNTAVACCLKILKINNRTADIPARFEQLLASGIAPVNLYPLYDDYFYFIVTIKNKDLSKQMLSFGEKLYGILDRPDDKKQMAMLLMDGSFTIGDYKRSLQIIDANEKYWKKDLVDSARIKIGAHLALQNKKYNKAIDGFRKYMDYTASNDAVVVNPVSEQFYTSDMLLGFNALRIGDIMRNNLHDEDGARKVYDEAEQYFKKATGRFKPDSKEAKYIEEQMAQIASRKEK